MKKSLFRSMAVVLAVHSVASSGIAEGRAQSVEKETRAERQATRETLLAKIDETSAYLESLNTELQEARVRLAETGRPANEKIFINAMKVTATIAGLGVVLAIKPLVKPSKAADALENDKMLMAMGTSIAVLGGFLTAGAAGGAHLVENDVEKVEKAINQARTELSVLKLQLSRQ